MLLRFTVERISHRPTTHAPCHTRTDLTSAGVRHVIKPYLPSCIGSMLWIISCRRPWRKWPWPWPWPWPWLVGPGAGRVVMPLPAEPPAEPPAPDPPPTLVWLEVAALLACCEQKCTYTVTQSSHLLVMLKVATRKVISG